MTDITFFGHGSPGKQQKPVEKSLLAQNVYPASIQLSLQLLLLIDLDLKSFFIKFFYSRVSCPLTKTKCNKALKISFIFNYNN